MDNRKKLTILLKVVLFSGILILCLLGANKVLMLKDGVVKYERFYEEEESFDILFFGSSRVLDAFQPLELWEKYGIRSYNMAQHSEALTINYWQIKNALKYNSPNLIVVDVSLFSGGGPSVDDQESRSYFHKQIDHMPLTKDKVQMITSIVPSELYAEYIFPFILYHSRWNFLHLSDFQKKYDNRQGAEVRTNIMPQERIPWDDEQEADIFMPENINLDKIITLGQENNINILFICMPCNENAYVMGTLNAIEEYLNDKNQTFINLSREENILNYSTDFSDTSHVNLAGSLKLTNLIGEYYTNNYSVINVDEKTKKNWMNYLKEYQKGKDCLICSYQDNAEYLMMTTYCDDDYRVEIQTSEEDYISHNVNIYFPETKPIEGDTPFTIRVFRKGEEVAMVEYSETID